MKIIQWFRKYATLIDLAIFIPCGVIGLLALLGGQPAGAVLLLFTTWRLGRLLLHRVFRTEKGVE